MHQETTCDLYLRLSLERDGKTAIERQEADCRAWAERNGLTVRKVHVDRGRSGYKAVERKGFAAALASGSVSAARRGTSGRGGSGSAGRRTDHGSTRIVSPRTGTRRRWRP
ncbi:recombinase family protein [Streptomyces sp. E-08]|uniref:recombinase family protein n=1 Tax=Streptomyces sp. E-08 TaxID=3404047 RepID=UPI003CF02B39